MAQTFSMTINGRAHQAEQMMDVVNPATGDVFAQAPRATQADLDAAVAAAQQAFPKWRAVPYEERAALMLKAGDAILANAEELTELFTAEQGRPLTLAKEEILGAGMWFKGMAQFSMPAEVVEDTDERRVEVHREPIGVVCGIVPWNFPVLLASWKMSHALLAGNTMVLKPSPYTPLTSLRVGQILNKVLPEGVLNVISGGDELGPMMTAHPGFAKISFTGSTATGKRIMEAAAKDLKRITLELGGNDACIVLPDVNVDEVAQKLFMGAFFNTAQVCVATKRLYIHDSIYDELKEKLHGLAQVMKVGNGAEADSIFGPLQNKPQFERVKAMMAGAKDRGLTLLEGGPVPDRGYFLPLTLVDNPPEDDPVVVEEAFGPLLPLLRYSDVDEVIERANNSEYGLAGAVWSSDIDKAMAVAKRLDTGTVWINQNLQTTPNTPLGGHKHSGIGVENGRDGLMEFTQPKTIFIPKV
ncbi:aldehyde dehydrogenase family protein [Spongiibacter nanhainus]|uniref:Aldehyde dehydrogenase family protein n=1 Tax=Spongiibacter nanhainus TaxID=2794344 RepID=A0A7T4QY83_9GAMM|nr:aldehyde dehydrogenase family protein [Spongiibacter nanhainus]QQD17004.1 aldehyde dehydrogenase family protein [Spongiibacter nanhainus]